MCISGGKIWNGMTVCGYVKGLQLWIGIFSTVGLMFLEQSILFSGSGFPSNATLVWIFYSVTATCFGLVTIFWRQKPWTWPSTRNRMQTTNFKTILSFLCVLSSTRGGILPCPPFEIIAAYTETGSLLVLIFWSKHTRWCSGFLQWQLPDTITHSDGQMKGSRSAW
jgi:hypothetical protein